jgi:hypothetical protein
VTRAGDAGSVTPDQDDGTVPASAGAQLAALGPFFAADLLTAVPPGGAWRPMAELFDDPSVMRERVAAVRGFLASGTGQDPDAVELRVAASVVHLGLVARILAPLVGLTVLGFRVPWVVVGGLWWQPTLGSMFPLAMTADVPGGPRPRVLEAVGGLGSLAAPFGVNDHILRGNIASALGGAVNAVSAARPELAATARALLADLLDESGLGDAAHVEPSAALRRHSCCLIYRATPARDGALCGDCPLNRAVG